MSTSLVVNGVSYLYPNTGDQTWGAVASAWAAAVTTGMLQMAGGAFPLTADVNFGMNFGLLSLYFTSQSANAAASGIVRLANTEAIKWRNNANNADVALAKNSSDQLTWAGNVISSAAGVTPVAAGGTGLTSGTSGGILGFTAIGTIASSALLAQYGVVLGGGAGATPTALAPNSSTAYPLVSGGISANPIWALLTAAGGGTGVSSVTTAPTASSFAGWDANSNLSANNLIDGFATTVTAAATTTLTVASAGVQYFTGSTTQTVKLPVVATGPLPFGFQFTIVNLSSGAVTVQSSGSNTLQAMAANTQLVCSVILQSGTGTASWNWQYTAIQNSLAGGGSVTSVGFSVPATSIFGTSGSPVTTTGTLGLTTTGTSGGVPYFSSSSVISSSAALTQYGVVYGGGAGATPVATAAGTTGQALVATTSAAPSWGALGTAGVATATFTAPTVSVATASGTGTGGFGNSQTGWLFTVTGWTGTIAVGDTYTNNANTYTVQGAQTNGTGQTLFMSGTGATSGSTLTKAVSASGPATITFSAKVASYTYTTPTSPRAPVALRVLIAGGGGGGGPGSTSSTVGGDGNPSFFGANVFKALGGGGGSLGGNYTTGGAASVSSPALALLQLTGGSGGADVAYLIAGQTAPGGGGTGGANPLGGFGQQAGYSPSAGNAAIANTGGGGGGGGNSGTQGQFYGSGGAAGGYATGIWATSVPATIPYIIGGGGAGGTGTYAGGAGGSGVITIEEYYQ